MVKKKNNQGLIFGALAALLLFGGQKRNGASSGSSGGSAGNHSITSADLQSAFAKATAAFGSKIAGETEQLYRKETRNFESGQFFKTYTPGMEQAPGRDDFPYGWGSLNRFLAEFPKYKGSFYLVPMTENNTGKTKKYIGFPTLEGAVMFVAWTIKDRGNPGYWRSTDPTIANAYYQSLLKYPKQYT